MSPLSQRAKNRAKEHDLVALRMGTFEGKESVLTKCASKHDPNCEWTGWFTLYEMKWRWTNDADNDGTA